MRLEFTKMHGIGNDYVYVNGFEQDVEDRPAVARKVSDRHLGVGGDGLILIQPPSSPENDCRMEMYNADGSRAQMCGNGIRCVAKYVYDHGIARKEEIRAETDLDVKTLRIVTGDDGTCEKVVVDMGAPKLRRRDLPLVDGADPEGQAIHQPMEALGRSFFVTAVSMDNPHAVIRLDDPAHRADGADPLPALEDLPLAEWGPHFENHAWFPERVNTEFITLRSRTEMDFRVWERGSGETLACGTGACAAVVAAVLNDWCDREVVVHLRGGDLEVRWEDGDPGGRVWMTGGATEVFRGEMEV